MRQGKHSQRGRHLDGKQRQLLSVAAIPLVVIILMIIIVIADHTKAANSTETEPIQTSDMGEEVTAPSEPESLLSPGEIEPETMEAEPESEPGDEFATATLQRDPNPEILDLMKEYFNARATADAETMNRIYGVSEVSAADLETQKERMRSNSRYMEGFENAATYVMNGVTGDSWLTYTIADIRFHGVNTTAPMIMWCYVTKDGEGNYLIKDSSQLSENILNFIENANHTEDVRKLASNVNMRLRNALNEDEELNSVYGVLRDGSPVWEDGDEEPIVVVGGTEESMNIETAAGDETSSAATEAETQPEIRIQ